MISRCFIEAVTFVNTVSKYRVDLASFFVKIFTIEELHINVMQLKPKSQGRDIDLHFLHYGWATVAR